MKRRKGISLIETLISLTIVGIALVALLPVMTVRKDGNDPSRGNRYWDSLTDENCTGDAIAGSNLIKKCDMYYPHLNGAAISASVGNPVEPKVDNNAVYFKVYNEGFGNSKIPALHVTGDNTNHLAFRWKGMDIDTTTDGTLDIHSGVPFGTSTLLYPKRIYSDSSKLVIENNLEHDVVYSFGSGATPYDAKSSTNYYYLVNDGAEYLSVDATNNVIGIGKNAVRKYPGKGIIAILNAPNSLVNATKQSCIGVPEVNVDPDNPVLVSCTENSLVIGAQTNADNYSEQQDFIIWRAGNSTASPFYINAPVSTYKFQASQILVSSDKRLKNIIGNYDKSISELMRIKPVEYNLKSDKDKKTYVGVVAQDLQKIFPEAVVVNKATGYLMVSQDPVFYAMLNSIKDLDEKNKQLKADNDKLEAKVAQLRAIRDRLKASQGGINE